MNSSISRIFFVGIRNRKIDFVRMKFFQFPNSFIFSPSTSSIFIRNYASSESGKMDQRTSRFENLPNKIAQPGFKEGPSKDSEIPLHERFRKYAHFFAGLSVGIGIYFVAQFSTNYAKATKGPIITSSIQNKDWEEDVVYLYQFPRPKDSPNYSPYCLKVETFLRMNNIKYEIIETTFWKSDENLLPFIEMNGEYFADSELIIMKLREHFNIKEDYLTPVQKATSRALEYLLNKGIFNTANYLKFKGHMQEWSQTFLESIGVPDWISRELKYHMAIWMTSKIDARLLAETTARHSKEDIEKILRQDLEAIDTILGDKPFLFGKKPSSVDGTLFAHLAAVYYLPFAHEAQDILDEEFPRVKKHMERMKQLYFKE